MSKPDVVITSEAYRVYHYPNGAEFKIEAPRDLYILKDDKGVSHRILAEDGRTYRPERGWIGISWQPKPGQPAFVA
jgi:hypothetical protein